MRWATVHSIALIINKGNWIINERHFGICQKPLMLFFVYLNLMDIDLQHESSTD